MKIAPHPHLHAHVEGGMEKSERVCVCMCVFVSWRQGETPGVWTSGGWILTRL